VLKKPQATRRKTSSSRPLRTTDYRAVYRLHILLKKIAIVSLRIIEEYRSFQKEKPLKLI